MDAGAHACLMNTAVSRSDDPAVMAEAMRLAVIAGRLGSRAGRVPRSEVAVPSSPVAGLVDSEARAEIVKDDLGDGKSLLILNSAAGKPALLRHVQASEVVAGEASAQTASVLEGVPGLLEKGGSVPDSGPYRAHELASYFPVQK